MKKNLFHVFSIGLLVSLSSAVAFAQDVEDRRTVSAASSIYVISAKAGGVNFVEGKVSVTRKVGKSGYLLNGDELEIGDKVSTGADGKAEILLNPGSFVRLAENSTFEFTTTSLEDLQLKLDGGSAMFEIITDNDFTVAVKTPKAKFYIVKTGIYRIDAAHDGVDKIEVWKGKARVGETNATTVKSGKQATTDGSQVTVAKFDRGEKDALETFSKARAKQLAKVNARLQNRAVKASLINSFYRTGWSLNDSYGLWVYSPAFGSFCFLPFGYGWNSPYGFYYPRDIWYYNLPPVVYNPPPATPKSLGSGISDKISNSRSNREDEQTRIVPPYQKIQREIGRDPVEQQIEFGASPRLIEQTRIQSTPPSPPPPAPFLIIPTTPPTNKGGN